MGNQRGTLLIQADQQRTGPYWAEMWAISGENVGRIWDPCWEHGTHMKMVDKTVWAHMGCSYGAHIVARMGPIWGHVFVLT